jgi:phosphoinositide-3-kinase regulatory subunit 4
LEDIEKKWVAFQLLCALRDCHARDIFHGDIKTENTLVTSWNWLYLADFSSSFKPTYMPSDNPAEYHYFFATSVKRGPQTQPCYTAPERFVASGKVADPDAPITWAMDIFSAGCVLAELFLEGPLLTLESLFRYQRGEFDVRLILNRIVDKDVRELVAHMVQIDPEKRFSAEEYLQFWAKKVFPDYFYSFLHQYMGLVTDPSSGRNPISGASANLGEPDERIDRVWLDFDKISYFLGYENDKENKTESDPTSSGLGLDLFPVHLNIPNNEHHLSGKGAKQLADDGTPIFLALVVASLRNTARSAAKLRACDLLLAFSERLTDEAKLDKVLPHFIRLLSDSADIVKVAAIRSMTQLLAMVTVVSPMNAHVFPEYILQHTQELLHGPKKKSRPLVRATYAACLGSLATSASRFLDMVATLRADGSLPTMDTETEDGIKSDIGFQGLFDNTRAELILELEVHTKSLITDPDTSVKQAFLGSVPELCMFFGTADSNDIILSHLNTYLNDRNWMLKCAFFETIVGVATFLGGTSLKEFILPLMVQALTDPEEFVIQRVLQSLADMAELGLFSRSKTWELVDVVSRFTMHPNIWIREAAAKFLSAATLFLSAADNQCVIMPLIKPYLKTPINDFSEISILDNLKRPFSRPLLDLSVTWALKVDRGIFWKQATKSRTFSFDSNNIIPIISAKELGPHALHKIAKNEEDEQWLKKLRNMGLSLEDEFKLLSMREYIWRLSAAKSREPAAQTSNLNNIINLRKIGITPQTILFDEKAMTKEVEHVIKGEFDERQKPHTITDALLDASMTINDPNAIRRRSAFNSHQSKRGTREGLPPTLATGYDSGSSVSMPGTPREPHSATSTQSPASFRTPRPSVTINGTRRGSDEELSSVPETLSSYNSKDHLHPIKHRTSAMDLIGRKDSAKSSKSSPETGTTSANAFGKVEGPFYNANGEPSALRLAKGVDTGTDDQIKFRGAHTYTGNDPNILKMLDAMYVDNYPMDIAVFGPIIAPSSRPKTISRSTNQPINQPWKPEGILVATFSEHVGPLHHIAIAPDHMFFLTGGDDGCVKVWDTGRLENNIAHKSRATHKHATGSRVTALCFVENTHSFISCATDGTINVVRVDVAQHGGLLRYGKLRLVREYQLPKGEIAVWSVNFKMETTSTLLVATNLSRIVAIDLRTMTVLYSMANPVHHGTPTCFVVDKKRQWLLLGTSHGVLDLWDLRFRVRLKAWGVPGATSIYRIVLHPTKGRGRWVCVAGGSGQGEVTVWDVEKTQCREVYRAVGSRQSPKGYEPWPVDEDRPQGMLGRFATALEPTGSSNSDRGIRAMVAGTDTHDNGRDATKSGFIITAGSDRKVRFWDLNHVENSMVVSGLDIEEKVPTFTAAHPTPTLTLSTESTGRPNPTAPNAASSTKSPSSNRSVSSKPPRSTVISLQQQQLLKSHLDSILDVALLESPYGMLISVDRSGVVFIFQ